MEPGALYFWGACSPEWKESRFHGQVVQFLSGSRHHRSSRWRFGVIGKIFEDQEGMISFNAALANFSTVKMDRQNLRRFLVPNRRCPAVQGCAGLETDQPAPIRLSLRRRQQAMPGPAPDSSNHCEEEWFRYPCCPSLRRAGFSLSHLAAPGVVMVPWNEPKMSCV